MMYLCCAAARARRTPKNSQHGSAELNYRKEAHSTVDVLYPTPILRPVYRYCYTVLSSARARSGVHGTQRPERPATIVHCTVPY